jgi:hypothetical protein
MFPGFCDEAIGVEAPLKLHCHVLTVDEDAPSNEIQVFAQMDEEDDVNVTWGDE